MSVDQQTTHQSPSEPFDPRTAIIVMGLLLLSFLALVVPWKQTFSSSTTRAEKQVGYDWIFSPPPPPLKWNGPNREEDERWSARIDLPRVLIPMGVVVIAMIGGLWLTFDLTARRVAQAAVQAGIREAVLANLVSNQKAAGASPELKKEPEDLDDLWDDNARNARPRGVPYGS
jgi:hypothetical protein